MNRPVKKFKVKWVLKKWGFQILALFECSKGQSTFLLPFLTNRKFRCFLGLFLAALLGTVLSLSLPAWSNENSQSQQNRQALELAQEGQQRYNAGQFEQAAELWQQAANLYQEVGYREGIIKSLINQSQALQDLGLYPKACRTLLKAFTQENPECNQQQLDRLLKTLSQKPASLSATQAIGLQGLGDVLRRRGMLEESKAALQLSQSVSEGSPELSAILLSLGNTERALANQIRDRWDYEAITEIIDAQSLQEALNLYQPAFNAYRQATEIVSAPVLTKTQAQLNYFSLLLDVREWWKEQGNRRIASRSRLQQSQPTQQVKNFLSGLNSQLIQQEETLLAQIKSDLSQLPSSRAAVYARINLAESLMRQRADDAEPQLKTALQEARTLGDKRTETYALGYLGQYYSQQKQLKLATELTQQALNLAQEINLSGDAREIVYLWQSQLGRLLKEQGENKGAIASYSAAFNTLQSLRTDLNANERDIQFDFRQEVKPVYLDLVDLLLESDLSEEELNSLVLFSPGISREKKTFQNRLEIARTVIESLQLAELDNFFQDPCLEEADVAVQIDDLDPQAAVIYPIILPERLEVILSLPGGSWRRATIPASDRKVNETLDELYDTLYNESIDNSAINIFRTIPLNRDEVNKNLQQLLPIFTQVYEWLIRPFEQELKAEQIQTLVFVLNDRFQRVPMAALYDGKQYLLEKYGIALVPSLQLFDIRQPELQKRKVLAAGVSKQIQIAGEIFPALINVPKELAQIQQAFPASQTLLDDRFTASAFQELLKLDFSIVHLATHGLFSSNPEKTFIITGDRNTISIDRLRSLLGTGGASPPELLVLSACETATGDERAVLGLAGVAARSGARSILATLWPVGDASTTELMGHFYKGIEVPQMKKLDALRNAQLELIKSLEVNSSFEKTQQLPPHPYYWAPYVLVGNWL